MLERCHASGAMTLCLIVRKFTNCNGVACRCAQKVGAERRSVEHLSSTT